MCSYHQSMTLKVSSVIWWQKRGLKNLFHGIEVVVVELTLILLWIVLHLFLWKFFSFYPPKTSALHLHSMESSIACLMWYMIG